MRIGDMLLAAKVVTELQLNAALSEQQRWGGKLGQILVRMGSLTEELLVLALCRQLSLPRADLDAIQTVPEALKERLDRATCERYHVLPMAYVAERRAIQLAMSDPFDVVAVDDLTRLLGTRIEPFLAGDTALAAALRRLYSATSSGNFAHNAGEPMSLMDNAGNARGRRAPPVAASPSAIPSEPSSGSFAQRVDEQANAVRAVADLLVERGVVSRDDLPR